MVRYTPSGAVSAACCQQVAGDTAVSTIKSLVSSELGVGAGDTVCFNGRPLADGVTLAASGVGEQDLLLITNGGGGAFGAAGGGSVRATYIA